MEHWQRAWALTTVLHHRTVRGDAHAPSTVARAAANLKPPGAQTAQAFRLTLNLKESVMDEKSQLEQQTPVFELGDAKELTQGFPALEYAEENPVIPGRREP
ncbi:MAG: hypothetical protein CFE43_09200 [Burkholderiales bacterium PBB3]|nr:MAG: hypothetical protein CFE43_09200 [Burkholderiales bacterium PBB3]